MTRISTLLGLCVTAFVTSAVPALAQTIDSPTAGQVFRSGPDYTTDVLHDPWDFNNIEDIAQHPDMYRGWNQSAQAFSEGPSAFLTPAPGWFTGTNGIVNAGLGLLYPGGALAASPGRSGLKYPINTSHYRVLSFKMRLTGQPSHFVVHGFAGSFGGPAVGTGSVGTVAGDAIYSIDLSSTGWSNQAVTGVRVDPNFTVGTTVQIDWVRLTSTDAVMPVSVSNCGGGSHDVSVVDASGVAKSVATLNGSSTSFNYGIFPPGAYQLRVACSGGPIVQPFVINDPPRITVLDPDERGGADFATTVLGNPWDMDQPADIPEAGNLENPSLPAAPGGGLMLRASNSSHPTFVADPQVYLLSNLNNATPIASARYRYLTYTLQIHAPFGLNAATQDGSVARIHFASGPSLLSNGATSQDILVWPGRNTYTIDLGSLTKANLGLDEHCGAPCPEWATKGARFLRLDPHEFSRPGIFFDLDNVTLSAPDEVALGSAFPIRWNISDGDPRGYSIEAFYDSDPSFANGATLIGSGPIGPGPGQFPWTPPAPGNYYIHLRVTEAGTSPGSQVTVQTSTGFLRVLPPAAPGVVSIATLADGGVANAPFTVGGCAYNGATGAASDDVVVFAHPLQGQVGGVPQLLGFNPAGGFGTIAAASCGSGPGYVVRDLMLPQGLWSFRVLARNPVSGDFDQAVVQNVLVAWGASPARNLRASITGNTVTLAWDPPVQGSLLQYRVEVASDPSFSVFSHGTLPPTQTSVTVTLPNGTYYFRVVAGNAFTTDGPPSNVVGFTLPGGGALAPPGPMTLGGQLTANPVSLNWSQAGGGPATYTLVAGTSPGASNLAVVPMGSSTSLPPVVAPTGVSIFVRVVATNAAGSTVSNEVVVNVPVPGPPGGTPIQLDPLVSGNTVTIRWNPPPGGAAPSSYAVVGRLPGSPAILAAAIGVTGTSLTVPGVPSGSYVITVVALYGSTPSGESNPKTLVVP